MWRSSGTPEVASTRVMPGAMQLTAMLSAPSSRAMPRVIATTAPLLAT